jgi:hypothetical protein
MSQRRDDYIKQCELGHGKEKISPSDGPTSGKIIREKIGPKIEKMTSNTH